MAQQAPTTHPFEATSAKEGVCKDPTTNAHTLTCGHKVTTSITPPTPDAPKSACAPNCLPLSPFSTNAGPPFLCPQCIETTLHYYYSATCKQYMGAFYRPVANTDTNVAVWVYSSMRILTEAHKLRATQGETGVYLLGHEGEYKDVVFLPDAVRGMYGEWMDGKREPKWLVRERSRSPGGEDGKVAGREEREYRVRSPLRGARKEDAGVEELVDRLADARVGLTEDGDVGELTDRLTDARVGLTEDREVDGLLDRIHGM
ncbi:hypothetical protein P280DRAFT_548467 [Massarina eburnea CBS 473.64]|uniref:Uncharacterized protein n=1 Tax=Massarina eburnea CBS 473.64 TaxID=1395130 RepID=A0A6A6S2Q2_9PLEO|nr:hypothetical protein P280DRAFT_548467 [Massarina eburnea CBS 473.64]